MLRCSLRALLLSSFDLCQDKGIRVSIGASGLIAAHVVDLLVARLRTGVDLLRVARRSARWSDRWSAASEASLVRLEGAEGGRLVVRSQLYLLVELLLSFIVREVTRVARVWVRGLVIVARLVPKRCAMCAFLVPILLIK
jgi:hypothetical protein